jgi:DNA-binding beta-propeller fold protein YncE
LFSSLCLLSLLAWSQTPDPAVLQRAVADAECLEVEFLETDPPVRIRIQDPTIIRDLAGAMKLSSAGFSTTAVQQSGHVFNIRVVPKKQGEAVHEFSLCLRHLICYGPQKACHALLDSGRFHHLLFREVYRNTKEGKEKSERLTFVRAYPPRPGRVGTTGDALAISRNGGIMYIGDGGRDVLHVFIRGKNSGLGSLMPRGKSPYLTMPAALALSPDDRFLYLGLKSLPVIAVVACEVGSDLSAVVQVVHGERDGIPDMNRTESMAISPDGRHAYVLAALSRRLLAFARNQVDGTLRYLDSEPLGESSTAVTISPDGKNLYVITHEGCLDSYRRNDVDGHLQRLEHYRDALLLRFGSSLVVSPDGRNVYTTSLREGVAVWTRDEQTGKLRFLEWLFNGNAGITGLAGVSGIAVHPDGHRVYVAAQQDNALTAFERQQPHGNLRFLEAITSGQGQVEGLRGARAVVVSPDGRHVYVGTSESPVVVFSVPGYEPYFEDPSGR